MQLYGCEAVRLCTGDPRRLSCPAVGVVALCDRHPRLCGSGMFLQLCWHWDRWDDVQVALVWCPGYACGVGWREGGTEGPQPTACVSRTLPGAHALK